MQYELIGKRIHQARKEKNMTQEDLAEKLDVSVSFICQVEKGDKNFNLSRISEVSRILEKPIDYFIEGYKTYSNEIEEITSRLKTLPKRQVELILEIVRIIDKATEE